MKRKKLERRVMIDDHRTMSDLHSHSEVTASPIAKRHNSYCLSTYMYIHRS